MLSYPKIIEIIVNFELGNDVTTYKYQGFLIWPLLRNYLSVFAVTGKANDKVQLPELGRWPKQIFSTICFYFLPILSLLFWVPQFLSQALRWRNSDSLVLSSGQRYSIRHNKLIHYPTIFHVEYLSRLGFKCAYWQLNDRPTKAPFKSFDVSVPFKALNRLLSLSCKFSTKAHHGYPSWLSQCDQLFADLQVDKKQVSNFFKDLLGLKYYNRLWILLLSLVRPRVLYVDCWTNDLIYPCISAAKSLGIKVVEIQHGVQECPHLCYHYWLKSPSSGWCFLPDIFWCWGMASIKLHAYNTVRTKAVCGGNLWLNYNLQTLNNSVDPAIVSINSLRSRGSEKTLFIPLEHSIYTFCEYLRNSLVHLPPEWKIVVKLHPNASESLDEAKEILAPLHNSLHVLGKSSSLYHILCSADIVLTSRSTVALEAMAFGIPAIVFSKLGKGIYENFIINRLMIYEPNPNKLLPAIDKALQIPTFNLLDASKELFNQDPANTVRAFESIMAQ